MNEFEQSNSMENKLATAAIKEILIMLNETPSYTTVITLGAHDDMDKLISLLNQKATANNLKLRFDIDDTLLLQRELTITANYEDNILLKFMMAENFFHQKIVEDNIFNFVLGKNDLKNLYVLQALQTAFYHAGYDEGFATMDGKRHRIEPKNMSKNYFSKVVTIEEAKFNAKIEEAHEKNNAKIYSRK